MIVVTITAVNISLTAIKADFHMSVAGLSWVSNAYLLAFGGLLLVSGRASDLFGRRLIFVAGIALFAAASVAGALATDAAWLVTTLALQGVGAALAEPTSLALITATFPAGPQRDRALSVVSTATGFGLALGLLLGGALSTFSWRWALAANVPFAVLILILVPLCFKETPRMHGRFDFAGALAGTAGATTLVYGLVRASTQGWGNPLTIGSLVLSALLLAATILIERRAMLPVIPLRLLADRIRGGAYVTLLLVGTLGGTLLFCLFQFMEGVLRYSPVESGVAFLPFATALLGAALLAARLPRRPALGGGIALVIAGALWLLAGLTPSSGYLDTLLGPLVLLGAGYGFGITTLTLAILSRVPKDVTGAAAGLQQAMLRIGASLGLAGTVTVFTATAGKGGTKLLETHGYASAFGMIAAIYIVALVIAILTVGRSSHRTSSSPASVGAAASASVSTASAAEREGE
jgi:MFS family permease